MKLYRVNFIILVPLIFVYFFLLVSGDPVLIVSNDSPVTLGSNITFRAVLENYSPNFELYYCFDDGIQKTNFWSWSTDVIITKNFTDGYQEGIYVMKITVKEDEVIWKTLIATNYSAFELKYDLIGHIEVYRSDSTEDVDEVAIGDNVTLEFKLKDPSNYLKNARFDHIWSIDGERHYSLNNRLIYNFNNIGDEEIILFVQAYLPNGDIKYGIFNKEVAVKVPVYNVNITGNPFLHHGEILHLNVSCNGSSPFEYCWEVLTLNDSAENFSCSQMSTFTACNFFIWYYFQNYGKYNIAIYVSNDVRQVTRIIEVMVYNVSTKPTLSTVIIPIVCSLLAVLIIAGGIAYFIQHRNQLAVEVANFDFQDESDSYTERTSFEKLFDSFSCRTCGCGDYNRNEIDPLLNNSSSLRV